ncbi:regulatory protein RecX [Shewanella sp. VB17]|uniref:regulatory protein RecX n=1 Tax=Shewanella sp. VB17 TaxID=2739432 RepID=UPI001563B1D0|nr:regulatory protein RecX [Shewanella sp. VB17]NRD74870.1 regulatory protein RecX [Shewanella sp. VB17]
MNHSAHYFAVAQLARRDYSRHEVQCKLKLKGFESVEIEKALDRCESSGFLDDKRYAELLIRSHVNKGHGPTRIRQVMAQKGLDKNEINLALDSCDYDWFELAQKKALKKYGHIQIEDHKDKVRRTRYLLGQGFAYDQISYALEYVLYK